MSDGVVEVSITHNGQQVDVPLGYLLSAIETGDPAAQFQSAAILRSQDSEFFERAAPALRSALSSPSSLVRSLSAELLAKTGTGATEAAGELTRALEDEDVFVGVRAAEALVAAGLAGDRVIDVLRTAAASSRGRVYSPSASDARKLAKELLLRVDPALLAGVPSDPSERRVVVGECSNCQRPIRVKARAIRGEMRLTCKCGHTNTVHPEENSGSNA